MRELTVPKRHRRPRIPSTSQRCQRAPPLSGEPPLIVARLCQVNRFGDTASLLLQPAKLPAASLTARDAKALTEATLGGDRGKYIEPRPRLVQRPKTRVRRFFAVPRRRPAPAFPLKQAELSQLRFHFRRQALGFPAFRQVLRDRLGLEIAPAAEWPVRAPLGRGELCLEADEHRRSAAAIDDRGKALDALARLDLPLHHPVD